MAAKIANMLQRIKALKDPLREKMLQNFTFTHHQISESVSCVWVVCSSCIDLHIGTDE